MKRVSTKGFGQNVCELFNRSNVRRGDIAGLEVLSNKVAVDLDMLRALMINRVRSYVKGSLVVTK